MMMFYTDDSMRAHRHFPRTHEKAERLDAVYEAAKTPGMVWKIDLLRPMEPVEAMLKTIHEPTYVERVRELGHMSPLTSFMAQVADPRFQWYTHVGRGTFTAARAAAGCVMTAVEDVVAGKCKQAFVAVRPPGHHAGPARSEGFCFFNNVAAGTYHARQLGVKSVAIVDFDRHHGNGTQAIVERMRDPSVMLVSTFQEGCKYDQNSTDTFAVHGRIAHNLVALPLPLTARFNHISQIYQDAIVPALKEFRPELLMISAGFDMHKADPLSKLKMESDDYYDLTRLLMDATRATTKGRVVSVLEGGYDKRSLTESVGYHMAALKHG